MYRQAQAKRKTKRGQSLDRRHVFGVIVCIGPVSESTIVDRCHRYYGMGAFEVAERLAELFTIGTIETVGTNLAGNPLWDLAQPEQRHSQGV